MSRRDVFTCAAGVWFGGDLLAFGPWVPIAAGVVCLLAAAILRYRGRVGS